MSSVALRCDECQREGDATQHNNYYGVASYCELAEPRLSFVGGEPGFEASANYVVLLESGGALTVRSY